MVKAHNKGLSASAAMGETQQPGGDIRRRSSVWYIVRIKTTWRRMYVPPAPDQRLENTRKPAALSHSGAGALPAWGQHTNTLRTAVLPASSSSSPVAYIRRGITPTPQPPTRLPREQTERPSHHSKQPRLPLTKQMPRGRAASSRTTSLQREKSHVAQHPAAVASVAAAVTAGGNAHTQSSVPFRFNKNNSDQRQP